MEVEQELTEEMIRDLNEIVGTPLSKNQIWNYFNSIVNYLNASEQYEKVNHLTNSYLEYLEYLKIVDKREEILKNILTNG